MQSKRRGCYVSSSAESAVLHPDRYQAASSVVLFDNAAAGALIVCMVCEDEQLKEAFSPPAMYISFWVELQ